MGETTTQLQDRSNTSGSESSWKVHETPQDSGLIPTVAVTLWLGVNGFVVWIVLYAIFLATTWQRMLILALITLSLILPADFPGPLGHAIGDWMMVQGEKYFGEQFAAKALVQFALESIVLNNSNAARHRISGLKTVIEDEEDLINHSKQNKALIFAFNPHDMVSLQMRSLVHRFFLVPHLSDSVYAQSNQHASATIRSICIQSDIEAPTRKDWRGWVLPDDLGNF